MGGYQHYIDCMYTPFGDMQCKRQAKQHNNRESFSSFEEVNSYYLKPDGVIYMHPGDKMYSEDRRYFLEFTTAGTLRLVLSHNKKEYWNSGKSAQYPLYAVLQYHGNFVCWASYNSDRTGPTYDYWETPTRTIHTDGKGPPYLILQNDGNLVLYDKYNNPHWASNTVNPS